MVKNKILIIIFFLILFNEFNFFKNIFDISFRPYYWRLVREYGICDKAGYGFVWKINREGFKENIRVLNFENYPSIDSLFYNLNYDFSDTYFILINFDKNIKNHTTKLANYSIYGSDINIKVDNYEVIKKEKSCLLIKKK
jgi:hypothetical protein